MKHRKKLQHPINVSCGLARCRVAVFNVRSVTDLLKIDDRRAPLVRYRHANHVNLNAGLFCAFSWDEMAKTCRRKHIFRAGRFRFMSLYCNENKDSPFAEKTVQGNVKPSDPWSGGHRSSCSGDMFWWQNPVCWHSGQCFLNQKYPRQCKLPHGKNALMRRHHVLHSYKEQQDPSSTTHSRAGPRWPVSGCPEGLFSLVVARVSWVPEMEICILHFYWLLRIKAERETYLL